jgi:hypothetical protein
MVVITQITMMADRQAVFYHSSKNKIKSHAEKRKLREQTHKSNTYIAAARYHLKKEPTAIVLKGQLAPEDDQTPNVETFIVSFQ